MRRGPRATISGRRSVGWNSDPLAQKHPPLIPAQAGIQRLGPRFRGDERNEGYPKTGVRLNTVLAVGLRGRQTALPVLHSAEPGTGDPMAEKKSRVICVGEVMVELARGGDNRYALSFGGDTFNTAVYLARAGVDAAYATALGDDPYSDAVMALAAAEGVNGDLITRVPGRMPGLYLI